MILQKKTINNVPQLVPLTADTGSGNPIGTIIAVYTNQVPAGYLFCDGSEFDETAYPALYALLGDNHTPDLREVTLKGIGESGRVVTDHVKSGGLAVGEFIDDRVQNHVHDVVRYNADRLITFEVQAGASAGAIVTSSSPNNEVLATNIVTGRHGATTEVKAVGVKYCIKATTGLNESQQDYVLNTFNENNSYSTEEHATGKKWIDGKPIWRKTIPFTLDNYSTINGWRIFNASIDISSLNIDNYIKQENTIVWSNTTSGHTGRKLNVESQINAQGNITTGGHISIEGNTCSIQTFQAESIYVVTEITGSVTLEYTKNV